MRKIRRFPTPGTIRSRMLIGSSTTFLPATTASPHLAQARRKFGESQGGIRTLGKASAVGSRDDAAAENHIGVARVEKDGRLPGRGGTHRSVDREEAALALSEGQARGLLGMPRADAREDSRPAGHRGAPDEMNTF